MLKTLVLTLMLTGITIQACDVGCLKCSSEDECIISDIFKGYFIKDLKAEKHTIEGCSITNLEGTCLVCMGKGVFLDTAGNKCVEIEETAKVENCYTYTSATACSICEKDYYLEAAGCVAVENKIDKCALNLTKDLCLSCEAGYVLSYDSKKCVENPELDRCQSYSYVSCAACSSGLVKTFNGYLKAQTAIGSEAEKRSLALLVVQIVTAPNNIVAQTACETALASNCSVFKEGFNECIECATGYFLTEKALCQEYPEEPLAHCFHYSSVSKCIECEAGYYFKSNVCTLILETEKKANCTLYDATSANIKCTACSANFYLSSNECKARVKSKDNDITNCKTKEAHFDKCAACNDNFHLTDDGLECKAKLANCASYEPVNKDGTLVCKTCNDTFYLKTNPDITADPKTECLSGTVENCAQYVNESSTNCSTCLNGYIKSSGSCTANNEIGGCTVFDPTNKTACDTCTKNVNFNFTIEKKCSAITGSVPNCKTYEGGTTANPLCTACQDNYELISATNCTLLTITNCLEQQSGSTCQKCKAGYAIARDGLSCVSAFTYLTDKCETNSTNEDNGDKIKDVTCSVCRENSFPLDFVNQFVCVPTSELGQIATGNVVEDCIRYDEARNCIQCNPNATNKLLKTNGTCSDKCGNGVEDTYHLAEVDTDASTIQIDVANKCDANPNDLLIRAENVASETAEVIGVKCKSTHIPISTINGTKYANVDPSDGVAYPYMPHPLFKYPEIDCTNAINGTNTINTATSNTYDFNDNCEYYTSLGGNNFTCLRCKMGYTGTVHSIRTTEITCSRDDSCLTDQLYGLDINWVRLFSCHLCTDTDNIPFIAYQGHLDDINVTFVNWHKWESSVTPGAGPTYPFGDTNTNKNIICARNTHSSFTNFVDTDYKVANNCALAVIDLNENGVAKVDTPNPVLSLFCGACKPGYYGTPLENVIGGAAYKECLSINNCPKTGKVANGCDECDSGFILRYASNKIQYNTATACISVPGNLTTKLQNCLAASTTNGTAADECKMCKRGYHLNKDKYCEQITPTNCSAGHFRVEGKETVTVDTKSWILWKQGYAAGCSTCESSHVAIKVVAGNPVVNRNYCIESSWIATTVDSIAVDDTEFIPHCKNYDATAADTFKCKTCDDNYVIKGTGVVESGEECFPASGLTNCVIASSASKCTKCENNTFALVNNACVSGSIDNCLEYNYTANDTQAKCTKCSPGFYKTSDNKCLAGLIPNCDVYENNQQNRCATCASGYFTAPVANNEVYCYPNPTDLGCSDMDIITHESGGEITCKACSNTSNTVVSDLINTENSTICADFTTINNCVNYDIGKTLNISTFKCVECVEGMYYHSETNTCVNRVNKPNKCTAYHLSKDECTACGSNSYLFDENKQCKDYPKGILGCSTYSDANTCLTCKADRYLKNNACPLVTTKKEGCLLYSSKTDCSKCQINYALIGTECKQAKASNCLTYTSESVCKTCGPNDGLVTNDNITSCENKSKTNCVNVNDAEPYNCDECASGTYLKDGNCETPTTIVECVDYDSVETCARCRVGFVLATNKKSCIGDGGYKLLLPTGCDDAKAVVEPICSACEPGYWFKDGVCEQLCSGIDKERCFSCDEKDPRQCFICHSEYYMNKEGKCVEPNNGGGGGDVIISASITSVISLLISLLMFFQ